MSDLRTLFPDSRYDVTVTTTSTMSTVYVRNTNYTTASNGGCCILWTVPANTSWAKFEVWGGGGSGAGACCCMQPMQAGGSGSYARKTIRVVPGQSYTICAAGSSADTTNTSCIGCVGFPSYACNASATYPLCLCASGGGQGFTQCVIANAACYNCIGGMCGSYRGADFGLCGVTLGSRNTSCGFYSYHYAPEPTYGGGSARISCNHCGTTCGQAMVGFPGFPGGGGGSASSHVSAGYVGGAGAGGLVVITYR